jgi:hypothetical protein
VVGQLLFSGSSVKEGGRGEGPLEIAADWSFLLRRCLHILRRRTYSGTGILSSSPGVWGFALKNASEPTQRREDAKTQGFPMQTDRIMAGQNHAEKKTRGSSQ